MKSNQLKKYLKLTCTLLFKNMILSFRYHVSIEMQMMIEKKVLVLHS